MERRYSPFDMAIFAMRVVCATFVFLWWLGRLAIPHSLHTRWQRIRSYFVSTLRTTHGAEEGHIPAAYDRARAWVLKYRLIPIATRRSRLWDLLAIILYAVVVAAALGVIGWIATHLGWGWFPWSWSLLSLIEGLLAILGIMVLAVLAVAAVALAVAALFLALYVLGWLLYCIALAILCALKALFEWLKKLWDAASIPALVAFVLLALAALSALIVNWAVQHWSLLEGLLAFLLVVAVYFAIIALLAQWRWGRILLAVMYIVAVLLVIALIVISVHPHIHWGHSADSIGGFVVNDWHWLWAIMLLVIANAIAWLRSLRGRYMSFGELFRVLLLAALLLAVSAYVAWLLFGAFRHSSLPGGLLETQLVAVAFLVGFGLGMLVMWLLSRRPRLQRRRSSKWWLLAILAALLLAILAAIPSVVQGGNGKTVHHNHGGNSAPTLAPPILPAPAPHKGNGAGNSGTVQVRFNPAPSIVAKGDKNARIGHNSAGDPSFSSPLRVAAGQVTMHAHFIAGSGCAVKVTDTIGDTVEGAYGQSGPGITISGLIPAYYGFGVYPPEWAEPKVVLADGTEIYSTPSGWFVKIGSRTRAVTCRS
jgi:hypothetical protein